MKPFKFQTIDVQICWRKTWIIFIKIKIVKFDNTFAFLSLKIKIKNILHIQYFIKTLEIYKNKDIYFKYIIYKIVDSSADCWLTKLSEKIL